jgi:hypothetical protein
MATPTAREQELLELLNRMRLNPAAELNLLLNSGDTKVNEALAFFKVDRTVLAQQWTSLTASQALAWSEALNASANNHNAVMIAQDKQEHVLEGEQSIPLRTKAAGYSNASIVGENIYGFAYSPIFTHAGFAVDWGPTATGILDGASHRVNMMDSRYREVGIAATDFNSDPNSQLGPLVVTQDFGNRTTLDNKAWLLGVAFKDADGDRFYDAGEGVENIKIEVTGVTNAQFSTSFTNWSSGGYQVLLDPGEYRVKFLSNNITIKDSNVTIDSAKPTNIKLDLAVGNTPLMNVTGERLVEDDTESLPVVFTVKLSSASTTPISVNYSTADGTAVAGSDYQATQGTLTFNPGETSKTVSVNVNGDTDFEADETFTLNLSGATGAELVGNQATATIVNNDAPPTDGEGGSILPGAIGSNNIWQLRGKEGETALNIKMSLKNRAGGGVDEIGIYRIDDNASKIDGVLPGSIEYIKKAFGRTQTLFTTMPNDLFGIETLERNFKAGSGTSWKFFIVKNGSIDEARKDLERDVKPDNLIIDDDSKISVTFEGSSYKVSYNDGKGNTQSFDLDVRISSGDMGSVAETQSNYEVLDLRDRTTDLSAKADFRSDAAYNNTIGLYQIESLDGTIKDASGNSIKPGEAGYAAAALRKAIFSLDKTTTSTTHSLSKGQLYAPFLVANETVAGFLSRNADNNLSIDPKAYFAYSGANPDRVDHVRLLGDNTFAFEDLFGVVGNDRDYNDAILKIG